MMKEKQIVALVKRAISLISPSVCAEDLVLSCLKVGGCVMRALVIAFILGATPIGGGRQQGNDAAEPPYRHVLPALECVLVYLQNNLLFSL